MRGNSKYSAINHFLRDIFSNSPMTTTPSDILSDFNSITPLNSPTRLQIDSPGGLSSHNASISASDSPTHTFTLMKSMIPSYLN